MPSPLAGRMAGPFQVGLGENKVSAMWVIQGQVRGRWLGEGKSQLSPCSHCLPRTSHLCSSSPSCCVADCCSVAQLCLTLCGPMDCSTPHFPFLYHLSEFAQTHVHCTSSHHPLSTPFPPPDICPQSFPASESFPESQLFASDCQNIGAPTSVLPMNVQG